MRGYAWGNMYLSSIQQGIQGWHAQNEIFNKYDLASDAMTTFFQWNKDHKTLIVLNGGYADALIDIHDTLNILASLLRESPADQQALGVKDVPVSLFREERGSLNGAVTSVFTVLPATCYCATPKERSELFKALNMLGLSPLEACTSYEPEVVQAFGTNLATRFKLLCLTGDMAR